MFFEYSFYYLFYFQTIIETADYLQSITLFVIIILDHIWPLNSFLLNSNMFPFLLWYHQIKNRIFAVYTANQNWSKQKVLSQSKDIPSLQSWCPTVEKTTWWNLPTSFFFSNFWRGPSPWFEPVTAGTEVCLITFWTVIPPIQF